SNSSVFAADNVGSPDVFTPQISTLVCMEKVPPVLHIRCASIRIFPCGRTEYTDEIFCRTPCFDTLFPVYVLYSVSYSK
ncbi:hypothetical protein, partial [uncultured Agathobaculum sp.]|uniref:hypothetical protein n=1 Tax=uncultured Agathobaculum sp. TaxID=2048140 RepID=UPI003209B9CD